MFIFSGVVFGLGSALLCLHCAGGVCFETRGFGGEETHERKHLRPLLAFVPKCSGALLALKGRFTLGSNVIPSVVTRNSDALHTVGILSFQPPQRRKSVSSMCLLEDKCRDGWKKSLFADESDTTTFK